MATLSGNALADLQAYYHSLLQESVELGDSDIVLLSIAGEFTQSKIDSLLKITENTVLEAGSKRRVMKRVVSVLIECLQNATLHGAHDDEGNSNAFLILKLSKENFRIITGNLILAEDANMLDYKINELNKLNKNELRKLYIETLCNENFSYKGGAGLGFLTVAKKSNEKLHYDIRNVDEKFAFFMVEVRIAR
jgi:hypothetical protein